MEIVGKAFFWELGEPAMPRRGTVRSRMAAWNGVEANEITLSVVFAGKDFYFY